jgi:hypothetical protein
MRMGTDNKTNGTRREVELKHRRPGFVLCLFIIAIGCIVGNVITNVYHQPQYAILAILVAAIVGFASMGPVERYVVSKDPCFGLDQDDDPKS